MPESPRVALRTLCLRLTWLPQSERMNRGDRGFAVLPTVEIGVDVAVEMRQCRNNIGDSNHM